MNTYKLRAECLSDVVKLLKIGVSSFKIESIYSMDCLVEFNIELDLISLRNAIAKIPDGHVMLETVQPIIWYTGERK